MSRLFDTLGNLLASTGRLGQVEYAMEAVGRAGPCLAIKCDDGIVLAAENRHMSELVDASTSSSEKIYSITNDIICAVSGMTGDGQKLVETMRMTAAQYGIQFGIQMDVEKLVENTAAVTHAYTQFGGRRPFGASLICAGWDQQLGYQVYLTDPSGNCSGWKGIAIGKDFMTGQRVLIALVDEKSPPSVLDAKGIAIKAMGAMLGKHNFSEDKIEMRILRREEKSTVVESVPKSELKQMINNYKTAETKAEAAQRNKIFAFDGT